MATFNLNISSTGAVDFPDQHVNADDIITWTNHSGKTITSFNLPGCVTPQNSPAPIPDGTTTQNYTVKKNSKGKFDYSFVVPSPDRTTTTATIEVDTNLPLAARAGGAATY